MRVRADLRAGRRRALVRRGNSRSRGLSRRRCVNGGGPADAPRAAAAAALPRRHLGIARRREPQRRRGRAAARAADGRRIPRRSRRLAVQCPRGACAPEDVPRRGVDVLARDQSGGCGDRRRAPGQAALLALVRVGLVGGIDGEPGASPPAYNALSKVTTRCCVLCYM